MPEKVSQEEILQALRELVGRPDPVGFRRGQVPPPAPHFMTVDDRLYIRSRGAVTPAVIGVAGRYLQPGGWPQSFNFVHTPNSDRSVALESFSIGEGFLLGLVVYVVSGAIRRGQCFVELGFMRGLTAAGSERQILVKDYAVNGEALGWPGGALRSSVDGPGMLRSVTGADPAANNDWSELVPVNARWLLQGIRVQLITDGNAANRWMHVIFNDGADDYFGSVAGGVQTANLTHDYNIGPHGVISAAVALEQFVPIPHRMMLFQAWQIYSVTDNLQATDNFGPPQLSVEEWIEE